MPPLGAHMSIAGGYFKAIERAVEAGCDCVQIFTKNNNQWRAKDLIDDDISRFRSALDANPSICATLSHASYLVNLATPDDDLRQKSINAMIVELERADRLGIPHVVFHPGAHIELDPDKPKKYKLTLDEAIEDLERDTPSRRGLERIVNSVDVIHRQTESLGCRLLFENTAGQGTNLGWCFQQLGWMLERLQRSELMGVCIDTCHAFAAGYAMGSKEEYADMMTCLEQTVGLDRVKAFHLNDSKKSLGTRVDRHDNIGAGEMGLEPFRHLVNDARFRDIPMYIETPKEGENGEQLDQVNLRVLRDLVEPDSSRSTS